MAPIDFEKWGTVDAVRTVESWPGATPRYSERGTRKGDHNKYGASFVLEGAEERHIVVDKRWTKSGARVHINELSADGRKYAEKDFGRIEVLDRTPAGFTGMNGNPGVRTSINRNASLKPSENTKLDLWVHDEASLVALLEWYSGSSDDGASPRDDTSLPSTPQTLEPSLPAAQPELSNHTAPKNAVSLEELLRRLNANAETGSAGELIALAFERERLRLAGCAVPEQHVRHVALEDVGAGYDIESRWNGDVRHIEVKSSTGTRADFYLSENERATLCELGQNAWLYLVRVEGPGKGQVVETINDPINAMTTATFEPILWRVRRGRLAE